MLDMGLDKVEIIRRLMHDYHINPAKAQELSEVALYNRRFLLPPVAARRDQPHSFQKRQGPPREDAVETEVRRASVRVDGQADAAGPQRGPS